jgi:hypothetical protein
MVFNDTFNNDSVISCQAVLLVVETGGPKENHRPVVVANVSIKII